MRTSRGPALLLALLFLVCSDAVGQSVLSPGDIGLVTTEGFWRLRAGVPQGQPVNHLAPSAFNPAFVTLASPRIDWERGTDGFLLCTGTNLYRVVVTSSTTASVTDLTPDVGGPASFTELDIHPGSGELYLLDLLSVQVFRFAPPFALGMVPDLVLPSGPFFRAMCVDSRTYPPSVAAASSAATMWLPLDGSAALQLGFSGGGSLDSNPQTGEHVLVNHGMDLVDLLIPPNMAVINLNLMVGCSPVARGPTNVAVNPIDSLAYVLAEDGLDPLCPLGVVVGGNHVLALPPAQSAMAPPKLLTDPSGSGIGGSNGDLAIVVQDFAFLSIYGFGCDAPGTGKPMLLDANSAPHIGSPTFALEVSDAAPNQPIHLLVGFQPLSQVQPSGCTVLVLAFQPPSLIGVTDNNGKLTLVAPIPASLHTGEQAYLQCAFADAGSVVLSNGLQLNFGP
jgi:hypothetical protein